MTQSRRGPGTATRGAELTHIAAPVIDVVDTTGAGDAFAGALAVAWGAGRPILDAMRWASAAGACAARRLGASVALPNRSEIDELYQSTYQ